MDLPEVYNDNLVDEAGNKLSKRYARFLSRGVMRQNHQLEIPMVGLLLGTSAAEKGACCSEFKKRRKAAQQAREKEERKVKLI